MTIQFSLPKWYDLHTHVRQDALLPVVVQDHLKAHCAGILAMPNTLPPIAYVTPEEGDQYWNIQEYREQILKASDNQFQEVIVPLYLTKETTPDMIRKGAESGLLKACKYYPPHGTTNADHGRPLTHYIENGVFKAMEESRVVLCIHGEEHDISNEQYFDQNKNAEVLFYQNQLPQLHAQFPNLKIVCEHITTKVAVDFVKSANQNVMATVTPQHLLYTVAHLLRGLKYHLYCLPLLKFKEDRLALRQAVTDPNNRKFFAGTDSAPHAKKVTECGCAAGCYTAPIAPQLYAETFEVAGVDLSKEDGQEIFQRFLCDIGRKFYQLPEPNGQFTLVKKPQEIFATAFADGQQILPLPVGLEGQTVQISWSIA